MARVRAADDFDYIRSRIEQLRSERMQMIRGQVDTDLRPDQQFNRRPGTRETVHIPARWAVSLSRRS
jgi:hypothetical protein